MKHNRMKQLLSLLLAFAMVLSMVSGAFAVGPESIAAEAEIAQAEDALSFEGEDVITVDPEEEAEEPADAPEDEQQEEEPVEEPAEEPVEEPAEEVTEEPAQEEEPAEEIEPEAGSIVELKWTLSETECSLTVDGVSAEGYYDLPEMKVDNVTFIAGLYYFHDGDWDYAKNCGTASTESAVVSLITVDEKANYHMEKSAKELRLNVNKPQMVTENGETVVNSNSSLYNGPLDSVYYFRGAIYNGFLRFEGDSYMWYADKNGKAYYFTGCMNAPEYQNLPYIENYVAVEKTTVYDKIDTGIAIGDVFFTGGWHNGYYGDPKTGVVYEVRMGVKSEVPFCGIMSDKWWYATGKGTPKRKKGTGLRYVDGVLFNGYFYKNTKVLYKMKDGKSDGKFTGKLGSKQEVWDETGDVVNYHSLAYKNYRFEKGIPFTGVATDRYYYKGGKKQSVEAKTWVNIKSGNIYLTYYFAKDSKDDKIKAVTGWKYITRKGVKYKYYFRKTDEKNPCAAVTDMFSYNSAYKTKKLQIRVSRSADMATILAYDSDTNSYCIPCKSFVVAMSKEEENTHPGTYGLKKKSGWFKFLFENGSYHYYLYPTNIWGSGSLFHSADYATEGDRESLMNYIYNQLGRNVTHQCVRTQVVNSKLVYNLVRQNDNIKVILTTSSSVKQYQPFGKMTLDYNFDFVGKLYAPKHSTRGFDPTDTAIKGKTPKMQ